MTEERLDWIERWCKEWCEYIEEQSVGVEFHNRHPYLNALQVAVEMNLELVAAAKDAE